MKVLVDEDLPPHVKDCLVQKGFEVKTVPDLGWGGAWEKNLADKLGYDKDLMHMYRGRAAGFDVFVTCDKDAKRRAIHEFGGKENLPLPIEIAAKDNHIDKVIKSLPRLEEKLERIRHAIQEVPQSYHVTPEQWQAVTGRRAHGQERQDQQQSRGERTTGGSQQSPKPESVYYLDVVLPSGKVAKLEVQGPEPASLPERFEFSKELITELEQWPAGRPMPVEIEFVQVQHEVHQQQQLTTQTQQVQNQAQTVNIGR